MTGRNSALGSIDQGKNKSLTSHQTALQSERQSCFPSPPAPSATCTGEKEQQSWNPNGAGPTLKHPWAQTHTTGWGWLPAMCVGKLLPTASGAQILLSHDTAQRLWHRTRLAAGSCAAPPACALPWSLGGKGMSTCSHHWRSSIQNITKPSEKNRDLY